MVFEAIRFVGRDILGVVIEYPVTDRSSVAVIQNTILEFMEVCKKVGVTETCSLALSIKSCKKASEANLSISEAHGFHQSMSAEIR